MKIVAFRRYLGHQSIPLCNNLYNILKDDFTVVITQDSLKSRENLGVNNTVDYDYVLRAQDSEENFNKALQLARESDIVIIGHCKEEFLIEKLTSSLSIIFKSVKFQSESIIQICIMLFLVFGIAPPL